MESAGVNDWSDNIGYRVQIAPDLSEKYIPLCGPELKPFVGLKFKSLHDGIRFYRKYAAACGFDVRLASGIRFSDKSIKLKNVVCNREGEKHAASGDDKDDDGDDKDDNNGGVSPVKKKWRRVSKRVGCKARIQFKFCGVEGYVVNKFDECHSHILVSDAYKPLLKSNRKLGPAHKQFVLNCARANIGATKAHKLFKEFAGGYANAGCTNVDFKNFACDLKAYVAGVDAQMLLDKLHKERDLCSDFYFDYSVDENDKLTRVFWADPVSRRNYAAFGDVVSFDATYSTNRYKMIFAPFTGKDNHGKCVTFAAGLLSKEDVESYSWLFSKFKECMGHCPKMMITDQDPAMKIAIERVLLDTRQRLCMWHIMLKVGDKVPVHLKKDELFKRKLSDVVWSDFIEPAEFESLWKQTMTEFGLLENSWFELMFLLRENWIPAYFRDFPMSRIFRTTSMSESENNFFRTFFNPKSNLIEFYMNFNSAIKSQRNDVHKINGAEETKIAYLQTPLALEKHASTVYTSKIFEEVQKEIVNACFHCRVVSFVDNDNSILCEVDDSFNGIFKVHHEKGTDTFVCSCKKFVRLGLLCSHIFFLFNHMKLETLPDKYIVSRWTKFAYKKPVHEITNSVVSLCAETEDRNMVMNQILSEFYSCVGLVEGNAENVQLLLRGIRGLKHDIEALDDHTANAPSRGLLFDEFYDSSLPTVVSVLPPDPVSTKGSRSGRYISNKEKVVKSNKPLRKCSRCNKKSNHDARNCPSLKNNATA